MKNFLVSNVAGFRNDINVGIAPGKFDTKQLILSALVVLERASENTFVQFVRTIDRKELAKCRLFINDDFTSDFPKIPSYHDIDKTWAKTYKTIISKYTNYDEESFKIVVESVKEKISDLEAIDCIMELYEAFEYHTDSFEEALKFTLKLIEKFISDSLKERMYFNTVKANMEESNLNYIYLPVYVQGWRTIVKNINPVTQIQYAIFSEDNDNSRNYIIESIDKKIVMKKYVKGMKDVCYSGRFFIKVTNMDAAINVIERLPKTSVQDNQKLA